MRSTPCCRVCRDQANALRTWGSEGDMFGRLALAPNLLLSRDFLNNTATLKRAKEVLYQGTNPTS